MNRIAAAFLLAAGFCPEMVPATAGAEEIKTPRCEILPLPDHEVSFLIDGVEKTRWHADSKS